MEVLTRLLPKLAELLVGEYNLQNEVKGGIKFLQVELEHMKAALEKISGTPADQIDKQDKIWARDVRELSYDIEDKVDTFMVRCKGSKQGKHHGLKKVIDRSLDLLMQPKIRHKIATDIRDIKSRVEEVGKRRDRYKIQSVPANPVSATIDPRLLGQYRMATELVGIDEAREELLRILIEGDKVSMQQGKIISIVGFGGLGKTTLANAVYQKISAKFECRAFVSVSQTPDMRKLLKLLFYELDKNINVETLDEGQLINELRQFLLEKRYFIVVDDIWDIWVWETIRCALPHNNKGYRIIVTTRNVKVAEHVGGAYNIKPLSPHNSRILLNNRVYGNNDAEKSSDDELAEVSDKIIKKCAGVPLAIITIASLLARKGRNKMDWYEVCNSIGTGMENSIDVQNMRKILSYSYYDMPSQLRTCLLYLSVFPEDYKIGKDRLIRLWIAEGFIQYEDKRNNLFETGESYFNEIINRSMIQPVYGFTGIIEYCQLHDMVLDLVRCLSSEEHFVTVLSDTEHTSPLTKARRLSLQNSEADHASTWRTRSMPQVRSLVVFSYAINQIPALQWFKVLRVLDLKDCDLSKGYSLKYLGSLFHLRYLNLSSTWIDQLPKEVENLQFLETLDIEENNISLLQLNIAQFRHLLCLLVDFGTIVSNGIWSLKSLEELSWLRMDDESMDHIEELGLLTELKVLRMSLHTDKWNSKMAESLSKLRKIQTLCICYARGQCDIGGLDAWVTPDHLRHLHMQDGCWLSMLPAWMNNPSHLADLCELHIAVRELQEKDLNVLGRLPALAYLNLLVDHVSLGILGRFVVGASLFPCLICCELKVFVVPVVFQNGAAPRLTEFYFDFHLREVKEIAGSDGGGFDLGLQNLPLLETVTVCFRSGGASNEEEEEAKAAVRKAAEFHPNKPELVSCRKFGALTQSVLPCFSHSPILLASLSSLFVSFSDFL
ncbi:hypothetical protein EJB05_26336 [Eragrostis curvula]|uniref:AAA+ ATPase domain-containing protein n=1 Tax=Eragrostis curvula TaxID=38414 RepID=A0A5J9UL11_9POAL|nr:hypothetical protein EJB05_26336 [Eragrostis curvula]